MITNNKEITVNANAITLTGKLKNIREFDTYGLIAVGNLTQRNDEGKCTVTVPVLVKDKTLIESLRALPKDSDKTTPQVRISGMLVTKFDRRPGIDNDDRVAPYTQVQITEIELV